MRKSLELRFVVNEDVYPELFSMLTQLNKQHRGLRLCFLASLALLNEDIRSMGNAPLKSTAEKEVKVDTEGKDIPTHEKSVVSTFDPLLNFASAEALVDAANLSFGG